MWRVLFNWSELLSFGTDAAFYFVMAVAGTLLFLLRLGLTAIGGDADGDLDMDAGGDSDASFSFFSVLSVLAFFMGAGWMGLACRVDWGLGSLATAFMAGGFGLAMMGFASVLMAGTRRLNTTIEYKAESAVGATARVYLSIPEKGEGHGQIEVSVSGRRKIMEAVSNGPAIKAFADVTVVDVRDDDMFIVEPKE